MRLTVIMITAALAGCASNSGVTPSGPESFVVSRQAATGFSGSGTLKAEALNEANQYCVSHNRVIYVTGATEAAPPYVMGNFPKAEIQFMCLEANDPRTSAEASLPRYSKEGPHVTQEQFMQTRYVCLQEAQQARSGSQVNRYGGSSFTTVVSNSPIYMSCMAAHGYRKDSMGPLVVPPEAIVR